MKNLLIVFSILTLVSCGADNKNTNGKSSTVVSEIRGSNDPVFISHKGIADAVTKQIWKEIIFGKYISEDIKMFNLGEQVSKKGEMHPYQIISYGFQVKGDKEIFRISLRCDLKVGQLTYQVNEEQYYSCHEEDYGPDEFVYEMKTAASKQLADFVQRKIVEYQ